MLAVLSSKGQVTIPSGVRNLLGLRTGDAVDFVLRADNTVELIPAKGSVSALKGIVPKPKRAVSLEEMEQAIGRGGES
ncbi:MAG: AbrB/MazE/SpoVT family DNA-binding domain-containing protein [Kiritimatiellae bacterium]|jgi:AbrB family looped-hinge helix DNA binding protein|nr:AbrB/MazE/SpoVT family DNA-binding domain-containing protein [Kiritimatiellia bacterium]